MTIEAKADEGFGPRIGPYLKSIENPCSRIPDRIAHLTTSLFPGRTLDQLANLRYQLIHAAAATLVFAKERAADRAVFLIYEFVGPSCKSQKLRKNQDDLEDFLGALFGQTTSLSLGEVIGPIKVAGGLYVPGEIPLYIGRSYAF